MSDKRAITTSQAPEVLGPYSQAIRTNHTVYISGQIPINPETGKMLEGSLKQQLYMIFDNIKAICHAADCQMNDIIKLTIFTIDLSQFQLINTVMAEYFSEPFPARSTVEVSKLPKGAPVEIEAILMVPAKNYN